MEWYETVFEVIDMRSFSNLWYWIMLAVVWSSASHWIVGVPFDLVQRAARHGGQWQQDLRDLVRINTNRILYIARMAGAWLLAFVSFLLTVLALLGFVYHVEFAQAVLMIAAPLSLVGMLNVKTAHRLEAADALDDRALYKQLRKHRLFTQFIGMVAIFITAMWGMWQNLSIGAIGS